MQHNLITERLFLNSVTSSDAAFILELVNTPGWLKFIGDRQVHTLEAAEAYVQKMMSTPAANSWVVRLKTEKTPIGVISFLQRDYLEHRDIGFAFLPGFGKQGYAFEAASAVLNSLMEEGSYPCIYATTLPDNVNSIQLLEKLGLQYERLIRVGEEDLRLYAITTDEFLIGHLTQSFFGIFTNARQQQPDWERIHQVCLPEALIIKKTGPEQEIYNLQTFMEPRKKILSDGTLTEFEEYETAATTKIVGNLAQRFSKYQKSGNLDGKPFVGRGNKLLQFIKTSVGWKINAVIWEDEG